jgi:hypothetical protein
VHLKETDVSAGAYMQLQLGPVVGAPLSLSAITKGELRHSAISNLKEEHSLQALKDKVVWFSAILEKQPKSLWGYGEGITENKTEKMFLDGGE